MTDFVRLPLREFVTPSEAAELHKKIRAATSFAEAAKLWRETERQRHQSLFDWLWSTRRNRPVHEVPF